MILMQADMERANSERADDVSGPNMSDTTFRLLTAGLLIAVVAAALISITIGRYGMSVWESVKILLSPIIGFKKTWTPTMENIVFNIRLPRMLSAIVIGGSLALAGTAYQSMFKNPMVSPDLLGVSSGASIGASTAILLGLGQATIQSWALLGGFIAVAITSSVPRLIKNSSPIMLVLSGVITGSLMQSIMGIIRLLAAGSSNEATLASITYWTMGSLSKITMESFLSIIPPVAVAATVLLLVRYRLNVLSLGENEAKSLGMNTGKMQFLIVVCATVLTACSVCIAGTVGWVGLVVPHLGRMLVGPDNSKLMPVACLLGSGFMVVIDIICRTLTSIELPVSIVTGIIGAPFYFYLLYKQRMGMR